MVSVSRKNCGTTCVSITVAAFLLCTPLGFALSLPEIVVASKVSVVGERVSLGMLLVPKDKDSTLGHQLDKIFVTRSPQAGKSKVLEAAEIYRKLDTAGIRKDEYRIQVPEAIQVTRKSQTLRSLDIEKRVKVEFLPTLQWEEVQLERIDIPENLQLPLGQLALTFECAPRTDFSRPFYLNTGFIVDGQTVTQAFYRTELTISQSVPLAARELAPTDKIGSADIRWEKRRLPSTLRTPVRDAVFFEGKRPRQRIPRGKLLTEDLFVPFAVVKRGDRVVLLFQEAKLRITAPGKSLASGSKGERIRVINLDSKKELLAEVLDEKTVRVGL
jgi:flagella basal body P-ring formation protein FlgA